MSTRNNARKRIARRTADLYARADAIAEAEAQRERGRIYAAREAEWTARNPEAARFITYADVLANLEALTPDVLAAAIPVRVWCAIGICSECDTLRADVLATQERMS